jgi:hypothetical protein
MFLIIDNLNLAIDSTEFLRVIKLLICNFDRLRLILVGMPYENSILQDNVLKDFKEE